MKEKIQKSYGDEGNIIEMIFFDENDKITSITRNNYSIGVLDMETPEFNSLVFKF